MKFNCGPTEEEKREYARQLYLERQAAAEEWHPWFAWFPVQVGSNDCRWLEVVERRQQYNFKTIKAGEYWEYRLPQVVHRFSDW